MSTIIIAPNLCLISDKNQRLSFALPSSAENLLHCEQWFWIFITKIYLRSNAANRNLVFIIHAATLKISCGSKLQENFVLVIDFNMKVTNFVQINAFLTKLFRFLHVNLYAGYIFTVCICFFSLFQLSYTYSQLKEVAAYKCKILQTDMNGCIDIPKRDMCLGQCFSAFHGSWPPFRDTQHPWPLLQQ